MADDSERPVPNAEIERRIAAFQVRLREAGLVGALVVQATDLYYLAGTAQTAHLIVPATGEPGLFVRRSLDRARAESPLEHVEPLRSLRALPAALASCGIAGGRLGLELDVLPFNTYQAYARALPDLELADCSPLVRAVRCVKSPWEVDRLRAAAVLLDEAFAVVPDTLVEGMTSVELSAEIERFLRRRGHTGVQRFRAFNQEMQIAAVFAGAAAARPGATDAPLVGWGTHPSVPKGSSLHPIRRGEPICVDISCNTEGYLADATRTFSIGHLADDLRAAHERAREILHAVAAAACPGVTGMALFERARDLADGYENFMGEGDERVSFVGHGVGLEIDEPPYLAAGYETPLAEGMTFALEPKLVFPGRGAVGIENTYVVRAAGAESLNGAGEELVEVA